MISLLWRLIPHQHYAESRSMFAPCSRCGRRLWDDDARRLFAKIEAHKTHRPALRLDPDGIHRCPQCEPELPRKEQR